MVQSDTESQTKLSASMAAHATSKESPSIPLWFKLFVAAILMIALFSCIKLLQADKFCFLRPYSVWV